MKNKVFVSLILAIFCLSLCSCRSFTSKPNGVWANDEITLDFSTNLGKYVSETEEITLIIRNAYYPDMLLQYYETPDSLNHKDFFRGYYRISDNEMVLYWDESGKDDIILTQKHE